MKTTGSLSFNSASLLLIFTLLPMSDPVKQSAKASWQPTDVWSACSRTCDKGFQTRQFQCVSHDLYGIVTMLDAQRCSHLDKPTVSAADNSTIVSQRECNLGSCRGYRWRVSQWGHCSQTCGGFGQMTREVECVYTGRDGDIAIEQHQANYYCGNYKRPSERSECNRHACPPDFNPEPWGKCFQDDPCRKGRQVRQLTCVSEQVNGTKRVLPKAACYLRGRPRIKNWRPCLEANSEQCTSHEPVIDTDTDTIVQMRRTRDFSFQVGQKAYVIPFTKVSVSCPVHYFSTQAIVWQHSFHGPFRYTGPVQNEIMVDKRGKLRFKRFRPSYAGTWRCVAGNQSATIEFHTRTPSAGFHDYIQRNWLWNRGMMSDDPRDVAGRRSLVQWVEGPWSACSKSCGDSGEQHRMVRCERVDNQFYHILDDQECLNKQLPKPISQRKCLKSKHCPQWVTEGRDSRVCTDHCLDVNQGSIKGNTTCRIDSRIVPDRLCEESEKPDMSCPNPVCQVRWRISPWSQCSRSCGGMGVRARQLLCVWGHDGRPAGPLCYANQLAIPEVIEQCQAPPCKLDCIDFSKQCGNSVEMCKFTVYRYHCCASCRDYDYTRFNTRS